jgi:hypothetical protein
VIIEVNFNAIWPKTKNVLSTNEMKFQTSHRDSIRKNQSAESFSRELYLNLSTVSRQDLFLKTIQTIPLVNHEIH